MKVPKDVLEAVMRHRANLRAEWSGVLDVVDMAEAYGFLPLVADLGGVAGLTSDGHVVEMGWDDKGPTRIENIRARDIRILQGMNRYPELRAIIPARPHEAKDCAQCDGTGTFSVNGQAIEGVTCSCGGLGWIPFDWEP